MKVTVHKFGDKQTFTECKVTTKRRPRRRVCSNTQGHTHSPVPVHVFTAQNLPSSHTKTAQSAAAERRQGLGAPAIPEQAPGFAYKGARHFLSVCVVALSVTWGAQSRDCQTALKLQPPVPARAAFGWRLRSVTSTRAGCCHQAAVPKGHRRTPSSDQIITPLNSAPARSRWWGCFQGTPEGTRVPQAASLQRGPSWVSFLGGPRA